MKLLSELEGRKDFEVHRDEAAAKEVKRPGRLRSGYIKIRRSFGDEIKIEVGGKREYEALLRALQQFKPETLRVVKRNLSYTRRYASG